MKLGQAFASTRHPLGRADVYRPTPLMVPASAPVVEAQPLAPAPSTGAEAPLRSQVPNALTLGGYGLGLWWAVGGPTWAGVLSIVLDEVDGRVARAMNASSEVGSNLDWGADVALVPLSLLRLGRATSLGALPVLAAPPILYQQATTRTDGWRPPLGSWRASIMAGAMIVELLRPGAR